MAPKSGTATGPDLANFTVPEKILLAADELVRTSEQFSFTAESLIVASWRKYPQTFGLKGFAEQFPDSNKILASIMGEKGLAKKGWLNKVGQKLYELTKDGRDAVKRLKSGEQAPPAPPRLVEEKPVPTRVIRSGFPLPIDAVLVRLLDGPVLSKQMEDRTADISFADACGFWDADPTQGAEAVKENLSAIKSQLDQADTLLAGGSLELSNGRSVDSADVSLLKTLNHYLQERFSRHINLIRNRVGKA
jgi:hypothetical protein